MKRTLVIGLGNPGKEFESTRHNLGQDIVQTWVAWAQKEGANVQPAKSHESFHAISQSVEYKDIQVTVLQQLVFMNESGKMLSQYLRYHELERADILVVHDDIELAFGEIKFQRNGSAHGHNGVRSIHEYIGDTDIPRLRIGIGRPGDAIPVEKFVLTKFMLEEQTILHEKEGEMVESITKILEEKSS